MFFHSFYWFLCCALTMFFYEKFLNVALEAREVRSFSSTRIFYFCRFLAKSPPLHACMLLKIRSFSIYFGAKPMI
jgi:hypothetical protein